MDRKRIRANGILRPGIKFAAVFAVLFAEAACVRSVPRIDAVDPRIGLTGDYVRIHGENFGTERDGAFVDFGGVSPTQSSYASWGDTEIVVRIPDFGESCLLSVRRGNSRSNSLLFSTLEAMPEFSDKQSFLPVIAEVEPEAALVGKIVEIKGSGFGAERENGGVYFTREDKGGLIQASEDMGGYEFWGDRAIRVRVPDGAADGSVFVRNSAGASNSVSFSVTRSAGKKILYDKRTYSIRYSADIKIEEAIKPNILLLWMPLPASVPSQSEIKLIERSEEPFMPRYKGASLFKFVDVINDFSAEVSLAYLVDVYAVETEINPSRVSAYTERSVENMKIMPSVFVPSGDAAIIERAKAIAGIETNPYLIARKIYEALLKDESADALLFCALCRALRVPAVPVAGVLVTGGRETAAHIWAEFRLEGFGWVPVDILLGKGKAPPRFMGAENPESYYFGNLDNNRIIFSFGETIITPVASPAHGRAVSYALQNLWEESSAGIKSYSSYRSDVTLSGVH